MAPGHATDLGKLSSTYYDTYVKLLLAALDDNLLAFVYFGTWWSGTVDSVTHKLALTGWYNGKTETHYIDKPPSKDIFYCNGVFNGVNLDPPPDPPIVGYVDRRCRPQEYGGFGLEPHRYAPAALSFPYPNRIPLAGIRSAHRVGGVSVHQQNGLTADNYKTNVYSRILHQLSYDGKIYGFAYDDNANQASYIDGVATDVILTISACRGSITPLVSLLLD